MKGIVSIDLHMVDLSNAVIVYIDKDYYACGSYSELTYAALEHKPVLICCKQGVANIPRWVFGLSNYKTFFDKWEDLKAYIIKVHTNTLEYPAEEDNWRFLDYGKIFRTTSKQILQKNYGQLG